MRIALCQINPTVGDLDGNVDLIVSATTEAQRLGCDLAVFSELAISGYSAGDLFVKPHFIERCEAAVEQLAQRVKMPVIVGSPVGVTHTRGGEIQGPPQPFVHNAAIFIIDGTIQSIYAKQRIPGYGVFDEQRWFAPGDTSVVVDVPTHTGVIERIGITICEDAWIADGPVLEASRAGASAVVNLSASPWRRRRAFDREAMVSARALEAGCLVVLCNQVGATDNLVFDGASLAAAADGSIIARGAHCEADLIVIDTAQEEQTVTYGDRSVGGHGRSLLADTWAAIRLGLGDYVRKNGFERVILGMSGGIDSALVMALAVDELGPEAVACVTMPSAFSSDETQQDAVCMARDWGASCRTVGIDAMLSSYDQAFERDAPAASEGIAHENLQSRIRGNILMALSNAEGQLVLATGNKSEFSVGYATLYGDMCGGFAPIKDVSKTLVYELARWWNQDRSSSANGVPPILASIIERPPTAELRNDQLDSDSLPSYGTLDALLELFIDMDMGIDDAVERGFSPADAEHVYRLILRAEYKRQQGPPGPRITAKAFGLDRRMPITNRFDGRSPVLDAQT